MLTDSEKALILAQERYRNEVHQQLKTHGRLSGLGQFLNSPLGLWILSSVVLAAITTGVTKYVQTRAASIERDRAARLVTLELSYRLRALEGHVVDSVDLLDDREFVQGRDYKEVVDQLVVLQSEHLFNSYEGETLRAVVWRALAFTEMDKSAAADAMDAAIDMFQLSQELRHESTTYEERRHTRLSSSTTHSVS